MKIKKGFVLKDICGESIIVAEGKENIDFTKIISMNESSAFLWESVKDKDFLTSSLKKHTFYNLLINNILYFCVT